MQIRIYLHAHLRSKDLTVFKQYKIFGKYFMMRGIDRLRPQNLEFNEKAKS